MSPGEYPQPNIRKTNVRVSLVSGYVSTRLRCLGLKQPNSGFNSGDFKVRVLVKNDGSANISGQFQQTTDRTTSGPRTALGSAFTIVPEGRQYVDFTANQVFLELLASSNGVASLQIESLLNWDVMAFDRTDAFYPSGSSLSKENAITEPKWGTVDGLGGGKIINGANGT